uniref:Uncharacterized protein n=1 Tax=Cacopsylla melanoneura TaxID=428564 RepID=A0A8D8YY40_9HEMI
MSFFVQLPKVFCKAFPMLHKKRNGEKQIGTVQIAPKITHRLHHEKKRRKLVFESARPEIKFSLPRRNYMYVQGRQTHKFSLRGERTQYKHKTWANVQCMHVLTVPIENLLITLHVTSDKKSSVFRM